MVNSLVEMLGFALILLFLYLMWWPSAILGAGILLVLWANVRSVKRSKPKAEQP